MGMQIFWRDVIFLSSIGPRLAENIRAAWLNLKIHLRKKSAVLCAKGEPCSYYKDIYKDIYLRNSSWVSN